MQPEPPSPGRPARVLMVLESTFLSRGGGGAEGQARTIALELVRMGHLPTVLTPMMPSGSQVAVERCYGIPVMRVAYPKTRLIGSAILNLRLAAFLWKNRSKYDAWHAHIGHNLAAVTCLVGDWLGVPVVVKISGWWELENGLLASDSGLFGKLARGWLKRATAVQAISTRIADELARQGFPADRIVVLPNAVDTSRFRVCAAARVPGKPFAAVFVGRLVPEKDVATLLEAWAAAFGGRHDVRLRLVGTGRLEPELREQAERLGISGEVEFLGHRDRVEEILSESHVGILPSRIEGLSNTLLEYMACGLPSLASRISGSEDFVKTNRNGWLFDVGDSAQLAACLREAESLPPERLAELGRNARADVESQAALPRVLGHLMQLYLGAEPRGLKEAG